MVFYVRVRHVNKQFLTLVSRTQDQIHISDAFAAIHPNDRSQVLKFIEHAQDGEELEHDFHILQGDGHYIPMHVIGRTEVQEDDGLLIYVTFTPISEEQLTINMALADQHKAEKLLQEVNEQLFFLNDISGYLLKDKEPDKAIYRALHKMMEHFDGDRTHIFELNELKQVSYNTYEVCAPGITSEKDTLQAIPYQVQDYMLQSFRNGQNIYIENVEKMPMSRSLEREIYLRQGIHNVFLIPIWRDGVLIGYTGVDNPRRNTDYTDQLAAIGDYMASMLTRRDHIQHMADSNELLQRLMNDTPGGFARMQLYPDGRVIPVFINDGFCRMMGMTREEIDAMYGEDAYAGVHPEDLPAIKCLVKQMLEKDIVSSIRLRFYHKKKGYLNVQVFYRTITDPSGIKYTNGYYADMTAEMKQEELRKELLDNLPCGAIIYEMTTDGILNARHINKRYAELVGRSGTELYMQDSIQGVHPLDRERMMESIYEAIKLDQEVESDIRVRKKDGEYIAFHVVLRIDPRENKNTVIYITYTPITEETRELSVVIANQRKAEKEVKEVNEQLQFLNDASRYLLIGDDSLVAINQSLYKIMEYFDGVRAYIFELDDELQVSHNTYECCADSTLSQKDNLQNVPYEFQAYALKIFKNKENICFENIADIINSGLDQGHVITNQGIQSLILVPLWMGEKLIGYMGVDNPCRNISHVDHLVALGDYMAAILLRRNNEKQIMIDSQMMRDLMNDMPGGFVQMKMYPDGRISPSLINEEFCRMSGMTHDQCVEYYSDDAYTGIHPDDQEMIRNEILNLIVNRNTLTLRLRLAKGDGSYTPMQVFYRVTEDSAGNLYLNGYYTDLTEQIALEERVMAEHDELTGLFNRTKLAHMDESEYQTLMSCGIIFFDVNHLKIVNDTQGHVAGDSLLCLVADSIQAITNHRIHGYRYGGDEFLVVVCNGSEAELCELTELWQSRMNLLIVERKIQATAAVGTAWSQTPILLNALIQKADKAMYIDKQHIKARAREIK